MTSPRIYVASLSDYNAGRLHGVWIDATQDEEDIYAEVKTMLLGSTWPNVFVDCPNCEKGQNQEGEADCFVTCKRCNGTGKVASAEEWAIHDHEGFEGIRISESESFATVSLLAELLEEYGDAFAAFVNNGSVDVDDTDALADAFNEAYAGTYSSVEDYAQESTEECYDMKKLPEFLRYHIDWEGVARDMEQSGDIWTADGGRGVHVFRNV